VRVGIALRIEDEMLYIFLLALFLVEFLVIIGVIVFAILFSRPEVPLKGDGGLEWTAAGGGNERPLQRRGAEPKNRGNVAPGDSHARMNQVLAVRPPVFAALSFPSVGGLYQNAAQRPSWLANN
jgi:hypothetical protein